MAKRQVSMLTFWQTTESKSKKGDESEEDSVEQDERVNDEFRVIEELEHDGTADESEDDYELNYDDESTFLQDFDRPGGETSISSPACSDFQGMAHTTQKMIERDICSDSEEVETVPGPNPDLTCVLPCCGNDTVSVAYQPTDKPSLQQLFSNKRNFQPGWYKRFPWLSVCLSRKKVFCLYCRYAAKKHWIIFSKTGEQQTAFTESGYQNWKKAIEKFNAHEGSCIHREALQKWVAQQRPTVASQLNTQLRKLQANRRIGLLIQLEGLRFLSCQAIAIFGHTEKQGNLFQLLKAWSQTNDEMMILDNFKTMYCF